MNKEATKYYNKLYKYCTTAKVHGSIYKKKLKELQQLTLKGLRQCKKRKCRRYKQ